MSDDQEMTDIFDEHGQLLGTITRDQAEKDNHTLQNAIIFIFNPAGKVWVQKRPKTKKHYPGVWDTSACGAVQSGEEPDVAAQRELEEETGLSAKLHRVESFLNVFPDETGQVTRRRLSYIYVGLSDATPELSEEVDEFKAFEPAKLRALAVDKPEDFVPSFITELDKAVVGYKKLRKH